jgi:RecB family exonuclease
MTRKTTGVRTRNLYNPGADKPFKLSRSKLERFMECPRCFYLDRRLGVDRPDLPSFSLNLAVDELLKREFDYYRERGEPHPLMRAAGIDAIPFRHESLGVWRENFKGVEYHHAPTNLVISGAIDDLWVDPRGVLIIVDYKATSVKDPIRADHNSRQSYKRQLEIYQWLFRQNGFEVSDTAYWVYANGQKGREAFNARLDFELTFVPHQGQTDWVEDCICAACNCLRADTMPEAAGECEFCLYRAAARVRESD